MYEEFFGLLERPFLPTPNPRYLYLSKMHREALNHMIYAIKSREGFAMMTGEIGTGKTLICRVLISKLEEEGIDCAYIMNPTLTTEELFRAIMEDLGLKPKGQTKKELIDEINEYLLEAYSKGKVVCVVIDEAQSFSPQTLEDLRLLSNLETESQKLLQIILVGQPELETLLTSSGLRQLYQRMQIKIRLGPLGFKDTKGYIIHRLRIAGSTKGIPFTRPALKLIYKASKGIPRLINTVCDKTLLAAYSHDAKNVTYRIVREALRSIGYQVPSLVPAPLIATAVVTAVVGFSFGMLKEFSSPGPKSMSKESSKEILVKNYNPLAEALSVWGLEYKGGKNIRELASRHNLELIKLRNVKEALILGVPFVAFRGGDNIFVRKISGSYLETITNGGISTFPISSFNFDTGYVIFKDGSEISSRYLRKGTVGADVVILKRMLRSLGYSLAYSPVFDNETELATKHFQTSIGLKPDGIVGPRTKLAILRELGKIPTL